MNEHLSDIEYEWLNNWRNVRARGKMHYMTTNPIMKKSLASCLIFILTYIVIQAVVAPDTYIFHIYFIMLIGFFTAAWLLLGGLLSIISWNKNERRYLSNTGYREDT